MNGLFDGGFIGGNDNSNNVAVSTKTSSFIAAPGKKPKEGKSWDDMYKLYVMKYVRDAQVHLAKPIGEAWDRAADIFNRHHFEGRETKRQSYVKNF